MKKILMGLVAVTTISLAGTVDPSQPVNGETIFLDNGSIAVNGMVKADPPAVKYVVFASDSVSGTKNDTLELGDFYLTSTDSAETGFRTPVTQKIFVQAVDDAGTPATMGDNIDIKFTLDVDKAYTELFTAPITNYNTYVGVSGNKVLPIFASIPKTTLEGMVTPLGFTVDGYASVKGSGRLFYPGKKSIQFTQDKKGEISISTVNQPWGTEQDLFPTKDADKVNNLFIKGTAFSGVKILIKVETR